MRIWVIGRALPAKENKMAGSFEWEQAQMLAKHGHEVYYPALKLGASKKNMVTLSERSENGVIIPQLRLPVGLRFLSFSMSRKIRWITRKRLYQKMLRKYGVPDIVHIHYAASQPYMMFRQLQEKGAKLVGTEHWTKVQNHTLDPIYLAMLKENMERYDAMLCVGEPLKKAIRELTGTAKEITVVPNIVPEAFRYDPKKTEKTDGLFRFVAAGRLVECKRFDLLIQAFSDAFGGDPAVRLDIIGGGEEQEKLQDLIRELGRGGQISLLGVMDREGIAEYYRKCDALVVSSNLETFGVPIIEGMAEGMPVITTDAMGFPSLFHKEQGIMIPADDRAALADAMKRLYDRYDSYDRKKISDYAYETFGEDTVYGSLNQIYNKVLGS